MKLSNKIEGFPRSGIRKMSELAKTVDDTITLCIGEPDFDTPLHINEAAKKALDEGATHYCSNQGITELREAVASKCRKELGIECLAENVFITVGGMEALYLSFLSLLNPGDEVLVPDPGYPNYLGQLYLLGAKVVKVPLREENEFRIQAGDIEKAITNKTRAIIINSPSNPTGAVLEKSDLESIAQVLIKHNVIAVTDEVYESIIYDNKEHFSIIQVEGMRDRTIIVNSFSKTYAMTGWRIGYAVAPSNMVENMSPLQESFASCVSTFVQKGALAALISSQYCVREMTESYAKRRSLLIDGLNAIPGFTCKKSAGTFYAFPNIKSFGKTSTDFAVDLLKKSGIVTVPGSDFGAMGEGYLRMCFATAEKDIVTALERISKYIKENY